MFFEFPRNIHKCRLKKNCVRNFIKKKNILYFQNQANKIFGNNYKGFYLFLTICFHGQQFLEKFTKALPF